MFYLVFETQIEAQQALQQIWQNMQPLQEINAGTGEVVEPVTTAWAVEQQRLDGKWVFPKPMPTVIAAEDGEVIDIIDYLNGVEGYTEEEYAEDWFPAPEIEEG